MKLGLVEDGAYHRLWYQLLSRILLLVLCFSQSLPGFAHPLPSSPQAGVQKNPVLASGQSLNLNLGSSQGSFALPSAQTILVGGRPVTFPGGSLVTAAEFMASYQVAAGLSQSLILNSDGQAVAGKLVLSLGLASLVTALVVPAGVTVIDVSSNSSALNMTGDLDNNGKLYVVSRNATGAEISALGIVNGPGALISTNLPQGFSTSPDAPAFGLTLNATESIVNSGVISSAGGLTLSAGGSIANVLPASGAQPLIEAKTNLSLTANDIVNSGMVSSASGNICVQSQNGASLTVNNSGGTFRALSGNIGFTIPQATAASVLSMNGGNFFAQNINLNAGAGTLKGDVGQVSGWINIGAASATFGAATPNLKFGTLNVEGDPSYFNTNGSLILQSIPNTQGNDLTLVASQDVIVESGTIDTTNNTDGTEQNPNTNPDNGGKLTIIAGAQVAPTNTSFTDTTGGTQNNTALSITESGLATHGSATGGAIDLSGVTAINTNGTITMNGIGGDGGNIVMVAFAGNGQGSALAPGTINLGTGGSINTYGGGTGEFDGATNGNVLIIAGASSDPQGGSAITLPAIFTGASQTGSQAGVLGGNIQIYTATPNLGTIQVDPTGIVSGVPTVGNIQATSVNIGSVGGGNTININNSVDAWQTAMANYAFNVINNQDRQPHNVAALQYSSVLQELALLEAEYIAATGNFGHFDLRGGPHYLRGLAINISTLSLGCCPDNLGEFFNFTPVNGFLADNTEMMSEGDTPGTHEYQLLHNNFVGVGFASSGGNYYFAEVFSQDDPGSLVSSIPTIPIHGGVDGAPGLVSVTPPNIGTFNQSTALDETLGTIAGISILPVSAVTGGANFTIKSGNAVNVSGIVNANGISGARGIGGPMGTNGGMVNINAVNNVNIFGIQASGGAGGSTATPPSLNATVPGSFGGNGGQVVVVSQSGNITINPGAPCAPCIGISVSGGSGGAAIIPGSAGGAGGNGGSVELSAPNGSVIVSAIEASGGGGSGGAGGTTAGAGGAGGNGGSVTVNAQVIDVLNFVSADGGGGGGAGGQAANGNVGGGGGGGSLGMAGSGGSGSGTGGGGGGGGGQVPGYGGNSVASLAPWYWMVAGQGAADAYNPDGSRADNTGGSAGLIGGGGGAGLTATTGDAGGAGGAAGAPGAKDAAQNVQGGAAGNGGAIVLQGPTAATSAQSILVAGSVGGYWGTGYPAVKGTDSLTAVGSGGTVSVLSSGLIVQYSANADLSQTTAQVNLEVPVAVSSPFSVASTANGNGTAGIIEAGSQANAITINSSMASSSVSMGNFAGSNQSSVNITEWTTGGSPSPTSVPITGTVNNPALVTPAQLVAIVEVLNNGGNQTLTLDTTGAAIGGSLIINPENIPAGGFTTLNIPQSVTVNDNVTSLSYSAGATINGSLMVTGVSGTATVSTPSLSITGSVSDSAGSLNFQGTGQSNALSLGFGAGSQVSTSAGNVTFNGINAGSIMTTSNGQGAIVAGGTGSQVVFNGGSGAVNVSLASITGLLAGQGASFAISTQQGNLVVGGISTSAGGISIVAGNSSTSGVQLEASGGSLTAVGGGITLQNNDTTAGSISISANSALIAPGGSIYVLVGALPGSFTQGMAPGTVITSTLNAGTIFFGSAGITNAGAQSTITASSQTIAFNTSNGNASISLGGSVTITAGTSGPAIQSLDLTDKSVVSTLVGFQKSNPADVGGTLIVNSSGIATGGNIVFDPNDSLSNITAENIPAGVTVTLSGFSASTPIIINTSTQVVINGTEQFIVPSNSSSIAAGAITINSSSTSQAPFDVGANGVLTSTGTLVLNVNGSMLLGGNVNAATTLSLNAGVNALSGSIALAGHTGVFSATDNLSVTGNGSITTTGGVLVGNTINFVTGGGMIGTPALPIPTGALAISFSSTGSVAIKNFDYTNIFTPPTLPTSSPSTASSLSLISLGTITVQNAISSSGALSLTANSGNIIIGDNLTAGNASTLTLIAASSSGTITQTAGTLSAQTLVLQTNGGGIGTSSNNISTLASAINMTIKGKGSAFIAVTGNSPVTITSAVSALAISGASGSQVSVNNTGNLNLLPSQAGSSLQVKSNGSLTISGAVSASTITLQANSSGSISVAGSGSVQATTLTMIAANIGKASAFMPIAAGTLTVDSTGAVYLNDSQATSVQTASGIKTFSLTDNKGIALAGNVGSTSGTTMLATSGTSIQSSGFTVFGSTVSLITNGGQIVDGPTSSLQTNAATLTINSGSGDVSVNDTNKTVKLSDTTTGSASFKLTDSGTITTTGAIAATNVTLSANSGTNGGVVLGGAVGPAGGISGTVLITADGSGVISQSKGVISGLSLTLSSGYGNIGSSASSSIKTSISGTITATTGMFTASNKSVKLGNVHLSNNVAGATLSNSQSGGAFDFTSTATTGTITVNGLQTLAPNATSKGSILIIAVGGALHLGGSILANGGKITVENTNLATGTITLDSGAALHATSTSSSAGQVSIVMGASVPTKFMPSTLSGIIHASGKGVVSLGTKGITIASSPTNLALNANGRNIVFSTGSAQASAIFLNDNVSVTADNVEFKNGLDDSQEYLVDTGEDGQSEGEPFETASGLK